jgi:hypothetical protein
LQVCNLVLSHIDMLFDHILHLHHILLAFEYHSFLHNKLHQSIKQNHINFQQYSFINYQLSNVNNNNRKKSECDCECVCSCVLCVFLFLFLIWFVIVMIMRDNQWEMKQFIQIDIH